MRSTRERSSAEAISTLTVRAVIGPPARVVERGSPRGEREADGPRRGRPGEPRRLAFERRPVHAPSVSRLVEFGGAVLGAPIVPEDGVAHSPSVTIDEVCSGGELLKVPDQV